MPKKEDIIYTAGLIDADGCITTSHNFNFRVCLSNTDRIIIDWLKLTFGGNVNNQFLPKNPKHNIAWKWLVCSKLDVLNFLNMIHPYLKMKKEQAKIVIDFLNSHPKLKNKVGKEKIEGDFLITKDKLRKLKIDKHYNRG